ncbi:MAG: right-handed parallel beta-helix repeat-containing protein [Ruminococcaceae bacterium]|nr:right-handed parallel beta-helix repeat-containing protein [Oscillospiraceae bacterium]
MKKLLSVVLAVLMLAVMLPVSALAAEGYVTVSGIKGFEGQQFASFAEAYAAIKPTMETLGLGEETPVNAEAFDALFTDVTDGKATLTYTISGNVTYDEASCKNLLTMGRKTSHYLTNERHLINFKFVGATGRDSDTLTVNSNITLPYEWWGEKTTTSISFENLTITGTAPNGLYPTQAFFEGINFKVDNCKLEGIKIYNCSNVGGSYTITNNIFDGTNAPQNAYAIHLQGNETAPLTINISNNTISGYDRGINIDQKTAAATISNNNISVKDAGRSCIQLTQLASTKVENNTMKLTGGNAITLHEELLKCAKPEITVSGNTINGTGYLIYDDSKGAFTNENLNLTITQDNTVAKTVDTTQGVKDGVNHRLSEIVKTKVENNVVPGGSTGGTIVIVPDRTEDTPKTEPEKNPTTGANDVVAAAVALMAVSALGMAVLTRKK